MPYTDVHRLYLQIMMSHNILAENDAVEKLNQAEASLKDGADVENAEHNNQNTVEDLKVFVNDINKKIKRFNIEIRVGICELSGKRYYILVNTVATALNLTLKKYSVNELEVFKKVIDEIIESETGKASSISCMNVNVPEMNKSAIESTIQKLVNDKWLENVHGKYNLSVRSITELGPLLKGIYKDDINACELCKEIIFQGARCDQCDTVIHYMCLKRYSKRVRRPNADGVLPCPHSECQGGISALSIPSDLEDLETHYENGEVEVDSEHEQRSKQAKFAKRRPKSRR